MTNFGGLKQNLHNWYVQKLIPQPCLCPQTFFNLHFKAMGQTVKLEELVMKMVPTNLIN